MLGQLKAPYACNRELRTIFLVPLVISVGVPCCSLAMGHYTAASMSKLSPLVSRRGTKASVGFIYLTNIHDTEFHRWKCMKMSSVLRGKMLCFILSACSVQLRLCTGFEITEEQF